MVGGVHGRGTCMARGACVAGGMRAGETATEAGNTDLTGMYSSLSFRFLQFSTYKISSHA